MFCFPIDVQSLNNPGIPVFPVLIKPNQLFYIIFVITIDNNNNNTGSNQIMVKKDIFYQI